MDPAVRQTQRIQAGIEATQDAANPGWLLQLNSNVTGSVNMHDGYAHYTSEAATDNGVLTQDRRIYSALVNSGMYSVSSTVNVGTYMQSMLSLHPVSYWRMGETGNSRVAVDLVGGLLPNLISNGSFEGASLAGWTTAVSANGTVRSTSDSGWSSDGDYAALISATLPATGAYAQAEFYQSVPAAAGLTYSAAINYNLISLTGTGALCAVEFFYRNSSGAVLGSTNTTNISIPGVGRASANLGVAPVGTVSVHIHVYPLYSGTANGQSVVMYVDGAILVQSSTVPSSYWGGLGGDSTLPNLITNPRFEADIAGWIGWSWTGTTIAASTAQKHSGTQSLAVTTPASPPHDAGNDTGAVTPLTVTAGATYSGSFWFYPPATRTYSFKFTRGSQTWSSNVVSIACTAGVWVRVSIANWTPNATDWLLIYVSTTGGLMANTTFYIDDVTVVSGPVAPATDYVGNGGNDGDYMGSFVANLISAALDTNSIAGWSTASVYGMSGGAALTVVSTPTPFFGGFEGQVVTPGVAVDEGISYALPGTFTAGVTYTFSVYLRGNVGGELLSLELANSGGDHASNNSITLTTGWQRFSISWTPTATYTSSNLVGIRVNGTFAYTFFANAAQVTATPNAVPFSDTTGVQLGRTGAVTGGGDTDTAVQFDGQSGYVKVPTNATLQSPTFFVALWANAGPTGGTQRPFGVQSGNTGFFIDYSGTNVAALLYNGTTWTSTPGVGATRGSWHHIVLTYDGTTARLYVDGVLGASAAMAYVASTAPIGIGARGDGVFAFNGTVDEVAVGDYVLSAAQISALYAAQ